MIHFNNSSLSYRQQPRCSHGQTSRYATIGSRSSPRGTIGPEHLGRATDIRAPGLASERILAYLKRHMVRFSIFGIPVQIQPFFWVTLVLIGGALDANSPAAILRIAIFVLAGFISILVHELGHALTARKFGARSEIVLQAFGGYAAYSGVRLTRPQSFRRHRSGPGSPDPARPRFAFRHSPCCPS